MARRKKSESSSKKATAIASGVVGMLDVIGLGFLTQDDGRHPFGEGKAKRVLLGIIVVLTMLIVPLATLPWDGNRWITVLLLEGFLLFMLGALWLPVIQARACFRFIALFIFGLSVAGVNLGGTKMLPALLFIGIPSLVYGIFGARRQ